MDCFCYLHKGESFKVEDKKESLNQYFKQTLTKYKKMRFLSTLQRFALVPQSQVHHEDAKIGDVPSLLHSQPLELIKLGKELRQLERRAALKRRKRQDSSSTLSQIVSGVIRRRHSRIRSGLYGLISSKPSASKQKDNIETLLQTIDTFIQWSRSHGPLLRSFSNDNNSVRMTDFKYFRYARPRVTFQKADQAPRGRTHFEVDDKSPREWRVQTNFNITSSALGCQQEVESPQYDFERIVTNLRGSRTPESINLSILLPPRQPWSELEAQSLEGSLKDDMEDIEDNANALTVVEDENQSQLNFASIKPSHEVHKSAPRLIKTKSESSAFHSCRLTIFSAYIALRWVRHLLALGRRKGFSLVNQLYFGEITASSQSASLLAILDLSPDNVITCPKLKVSLLRAKATEVQYAQKEALQKGSDSARHTTQGISRSPLLFFARNRVRHRRSENSTWSSSGNESLISSASTSLQSRRNLGRSVGGGRSTSRSGGRSGGRNSGTSGGGHLLTRKDSNLLASRPFRKRSISSFHMAPRKSSISSNISVRSEIDTSDSEGKMHTKATPTRERRDNTREKSPMFSMLQRLRRKNAPGYLSLQPVQRISERVKTLLSRLTINMMRGCKYHQIKKTRLGVTLAYALRNQIRDLLIEEHECDAAGCQDEGTVALDAGADTADTAGYRVITHVAVVEVMQQSIIMASQGLHEHHVDTYYGFTFRYQDAITVATVFLVRQFVKFPNVITTSNPIVRDVYERWLN